MQIHAAPVFAPARIQENILGELFMYWFRARGYTIGPERRVHTIEASDPENEQKGGFHGGVYLLLPC